VTDAGFDLYSDSYDAVCDGAIGVSGENREFFARGRVAWLARVMPAAHFAVQEQVTYTGTANLFLTATRVDSVTTVSGVESMATIRSGLR